MRSSHDSCIQIPATSSKSLNTVTVTCTVVDSPRDGHKRFSCTYALMHVRRWTKFNPRTKYREKNTRRIRIPQTVDPLVNPSLLFQFPQALLRSTAVASCRDAKLPALIARTADGHGDAGSQRAAYSEDNGSAFLQVKVRGEGKGRAAVRRATLKIQLRELSTLPSASTSATFAISWQRCQVQNSEQKALQRERIYGTSHKRFSGTFRHVLRPLTVLL